MPCRGDYDVRPKHHVIANKDIRIVYQGQVEIRVYIVAEMRIFSPIRMKRRLNIAVFTDFGQQIF